MNGLNPRGYITAKDRESVIEKRHIADHIPCTFCDRQVTGDRNGVLFPFCNTCGVYLVLVNRMTQADI